MKQNTLLNESYMRARIIGIMLIGIGAVVLINPTELTIKISFILILLGAFMILMINEKSISKKISDVQVEGNMESISKIIKELDFNGNAIFLPKSENLSEERIFIPANSTGVIKIPNVNDTNKHIIITKAKGESLGISIPPSGLKLLAEIKKDKEFKNITPENIGEKLQLLVGINLLKSVSFKKQDNGWNLEIEKISTSAHDESMQNQYPCPVCSAVITLMTQAFNEKIRIYNVSYRDKKIMFRLNFIKKHQAVEGEKC